MTGFYRTPRRTELVFNRLGDRLEGSDLGVEVEKTKPEKRLDVGGIASGAYICGRESLTVNKWGHQPFGW